LEAGDQVLHGLGAFHFEHDDGGGEFEGGGVEQGGDGDYFLVQQFLESFFGAHAGVADDFG